MCVLCVCLSVCVCVCVRIHACLHACACVCIWVLICTYVHTYLCRYTDSYQHTHMQTHTPRIHHAQRRESDLEPFWEAYQNAVKAGAIKSRDRAPDMHRWLSFCVVPSCSPLSLDCAPASCGPTRPDCSILYNNQLTGELPSSWGNLSVVTFM